VASSYYMICFFVGGGFSSSSLLIRTWRDKLKDQENIDCKKSLIKKKLLNRNEDSGSDLRSNLGSNLRIKVLVFH
jgi:hypothetical protein